MATKSQSQISTLEDESQVAAAQAPVDAAVIMGQNHDDSMSGKMEIVTISTSQEDGGSDAVFISINGYAYQIPRDKPCQVPTEVAQILRDAVVTTYKPGANGAVVERSMPRYAFFSQPV